MDEGFSPEMGHRLRQEARSAAAADEAECWARSVASADELALWARLEQHLEQLGQAWAVHEKPFVSRLPLLGPLLARLGERLAQFFLQNQVVFNARVAQLLQELQQVQRLLAQKAVERSDDLFSRLDERTLALESRIKDLEQEVGQPRKQE